MTIIDQIGGVIPSEIIGTKLSLKTIFLFNMIWIMIFAVFYFIIGQLDKQFNHTKKNLTFIDAFYFSVTTQTRVGYGDITPRSTLAKIFVMIQQISVMVELVAIISGNVTDDILKNFGGSLSRGASSLKSGIWNTKMSMPSMPSITGSPAVTAPVVTAPTVTVPAVTVVPGPTFKQQLSAQVPV